MYKLKPGIKRNPLRRWRLPDRIFYGHGACHILAGVYLNKFPDSGYWAMWIKPRAGFHGNHIFVTNGQIAFDYHGYSVLERLLAHHNKIWTSEYENWDAELIKINFSLLDIAELNARNMKGPGQYFGDAIARTHQYLDNIDHHQQKGKAKSLQSKVNDGDSVFSLNLE